MNLFINRDFFLLKTGQFVSQLGSHAFGILMVLWIKRVTGSAMLSGLFLMCWNLAGILAIPLGGVIGDLKNKKMTIILSDFICGLIMILLAVLAYSYESASWLPAAGIASAFLVTLASSFSSPAYVSLGYDIVDRKHWADGIAISRIVQQLANIIGKSLSAIFAGVIAAPALILINGISFILSGISEIFIRYDPPKKSVNSVKKPSFLQMLKGGYEYLGKFPVIIQFSIAAAVSNFFMLGVLSLGPFYAEHLGAGDHWYGYFSAAAAIGTIGGSFLTKAKYKKFKSVVLSLCIFLPGLCYAFLGIYGNPFTALFLYGLAAFSFEYLGQFTMLKTRQMIDSDYQSRVFSLVGMVTGGLSPFAMFLAGIFLDTKLLNVDTMYLFGGAAMVCVWVLFISIHHKTLLSFMVKEESARP